MFGRNSSNPNFFNRFGLEMINSKMDSRIKSFEIRDQESDLYGEIFGGRHKKMMSRKQNRIKVDE